MSVQKYSKTPSSNVVVNDGSDAVSTAEGMQRSSVNDAIRALMADVAKFISDHGSLTTGGTGAAYTLAPSSVLSPMENGTTLIAAAHIANEQGATLNVGGTGARPLKVRGATGLVTAPASIIRAGDVLLLVYRDNAWVCVGISDPVAQFVESVSATQILAKLLTVDGDGSGIDADLLDGRHATEFLLASAYTANDVLTKLLTVDGSGSNVDADLLDGEHGAFYRDAGNLNAGTISADRLPVGKGANEIVQLDENGKLPALDGSQLASIPAPEGVVVAGLPTPVQGSGGWKSAGVILKDRTLRVWGTADNGNLGQGSSMVHTRSFPVVPAFPDDFTGTPVKWLRSGRENLLLTDLGEVWVWGQNGNGCLGVGNTANVFTPQKVASLDGVNIVDISIGFYEANFGEAHTLFLTDNGTLYTCGYNAYGQLGHGDTISRSTPTALTKNDWSKIWAIGKHNGSSFAIDTSGRLYAWGRNGYGRLGLGDTTNRSTPEHVNAFGGVSVASFSGGLGDRMDAGEQYRGHSVALLTNGKVYTWGYNADGPLGTGNTTSYDTPQEITALGTDNAEVIAHGGAYGQTFVRKTNDEVWASGHNPRGTFGLGNGTSQNTFTLMPGSRRVESPVLQILPFGAHYRNSIAILYEDGIIKVAGNNVNGQLGLGTSSTSNPGVTALTAIPMPITDKPVKLCAVGYGDTAGLGILTERGRYFQTGSASGAQLPEDDQQGTSVPYLVQF